MYVGDGQSFLVSSNYGSGTDGVTKKSGRSEKYELFPRVTILLFEIEKIIPSKVGWDPDILRPVEKHLGLLHSKEERDDYSKRLLLIYGEYYPQHLEVLKENLNKLLQGDINASGLVVANQDVEYKLDSYDLMPQVLINRHSSCVAIDAEKIRELMIGKMIQQMIDERMSIAKFLISLNELKSFTDRAHEGVLPVLLIKERDLCYVGVPLYSVRSNNKKGYLLLKINSRANVINYHWNSFRGGFPIVNKAELTSLRGIYKNETRLAEITTIKHYEIIRKVISAMLEIQVYASALKNSLQGSEEKEIEFINFLLNSNDIIDSIISSDGSVRKGADILQLIDACQSFRTMLFLIRVGT